MAVQPGRLHLDFNLLSQVPATPSIMRDTIMNTMLQVPATPLRLVCLLSTLENTLLGFGLNPAADSRNSFAQILNPAAASGPKEEACSLFRFFLKSNKLTSAWLPQVLLPSFLNSLRRGGCLFN